jgi:ring-1,2-phenylacetyl-CoA epoxidase subunit PaaE
MIDEVEEALKAAGSTRTASTPSASACRRPGAARRALEGQTGTAELVVVLDGKQHKMRLPLADAKVLDTALAAGLDLPYACKGGVCCTCRQGARGRG